MDGPRRAKIFRLPPRAELPLPSAICSELEAAAADLDPINAHSLLELLLYMANMLLPHTDQMSMGTHWRSAIRYWTTYSSRHWPRCPGV